LAWLFCCVDVAQTYGCSLKIAYDELTNRISFTNQIADWGKGKPESQKEFGEFAALCSAYISGPYFNRDVLSTLETYVVRRFLYERMLEPSALSLRSRRKHKAWGASPRIKSARDFEPADAGDRPNAANA